MKKTIKSLVVIIAMEAEAQPFIEHLNLHKDKATAFAPPATCVSYSGTLNGTEIHVVCNGKDKTHGVDLVGTVPAALTTFMAVQNFKPDLIINAGTAGGFHAQGGKIGDIYASTAVANHDRRIPLPGFEAYGVGTHATLSVPNIITLLSLKTGVVTTSNSLDWNEDDMNMMKQNNAVVKDMEAAAIGWVANLYDVPLLCIKSVTDIVDGSRPTQDEFLENLATAAKSLQQTLPKVIEYMAGKSFDEL